MTPLSLPHRAVSFCLRIFCFSRCGGSVCYWVNKAQNGTELGLSAKVWDDLTYTAPCQNERYLYYVR